ncbi:hypothetical protein [Streptomyces sp. NPDC052225]|uniref:hypothetical protein n=1 Tax=Streptomyces sp. NPDC052225 TaxID=3154949 RepID=UPI0034404718
MKVPSITAVAFLRIANSENPERFQTIVAVDATVAHQNNLDLADLADAAWNATDHVRLAAEIEVLAGFRRIRAAAHPTSCWCDACRVRHSLAPKPHGGAW